MVVVQYFIYQMIYYNTMYYLIISSPSIVFSVGKIAYNFLKPKKNN
jgi:hypothetical protein